jgi:hypothetical protein
MNNKIQIKIIKITKDLIFNTSKLLKWIKMNKNLLKEKIMYR